VIYLYAITEATAELPACAGLEDAALRLASTAEVAGLYSIHERIEPRPQPELLWRHEQVVEAAMKSGPALPARFGTTFPDDQALRLALERDGEHLRRQLERMRGCVELAVRVGLPGKRDSTPSDGRTYLEDKLARHRRHQTIVRETLAPLAELAEHARSSESSRSEGEEVCASYLVRSDWVERFAEEVRRLAASNPELWLSCTGPWPPYSFVELEEAA
jgi:hypothetical protein